MRMNRGLRPLPFILMASLLITACDNNPVSDASEEYPILTKEKKVASPNKKLRKYPMANAGIAVDKRGVIYFVDTGLNSIWKLEPGGQPELYAGNTQEYGCIDGQLLKARFTSPNRIRLDKNGFLYVTDCNRVIRMIANGQVTTIVGNPALSHDTWKLTDDQWNRRPIEGIATDLGINSITDIVFSNSGEIYFSGDLKINKLTPDGKIKVVAGMRNRHDEIDIDGVGLNARFSEISSIAIDQSGNKYILNSLYRSVRKITEDGRVSTLFGKYYKGSEITGEELYGPLDFVIDAENNFYIADRVYGTTTVIRKVKNNKIFNIAGNTKCVGSQDGVGEKARFVSVYHMTLAPDNNLYVTDLHLGNIRKISLNGEVTTVWDSEVSKHFKKIYAIEFGQAGCMPEVLFHDDQVYLKMFRPTNIE